MRTERSKRNMNTMRTERSKNPHTEAGQRITATILQTCLRRSTMLTEVRRFPSTIIPTMLTETKGQRKKAQQEQVREQRPTPMTD